MRLGLIRIFVVMTCYLHYVEMVYAGEYDLDLDVDINRSKVLDEYGNEGADDYVDSVRVGIEAALLPKFLKGTGEFVYDGLSDHSSADYASFGKYLIAFGVGGERNKFNYGLNFYSVGPQHEGKFNSKYKGNKGRTGYEAWVSRSFEKLLIKTTFVESWTSNPRVSDHYSTYDQRYKVDASYPLGGFAKVSAGYSLGDRTRFYIPDDNKVYEGVLSSLKTKFDYSAHYLKFSTGFNQASSQNYLGSKKNFKQDLIYVKSTLFPKNQVSLTSSYQYGIDKHLTNAYSKKINKRESSFGLIYDPLELPAIMRLTTGFKNHKSNDQLTSRDILNLGARFDWKMREKNTGLDTDWTLKMQYKDINDYVDPGRDNSYWSFNLSLRWPFS